MTTHSGGKKIFFKSFFFLSQSFFFLWFKLQLFIPFSSCFCPLSRSYPLCNRLNVRSLEHMNVTSFRKRVFADVIKDFEMRRSSQIIWVVPASDSKCSCNRHWERHRKKRRQHVKLDSETEWLSLGNANSWKKIRSGISPCTSGGIPADLTLRLPFPEL